ncbi:phospholipid carrier-dependent glycosyltransferase [Deltaproteobacteria bacterium PRO3]|nr:phospholipid carrier-dependent glycosyltransferase [Deltaproteobacteria bacterium PRO3]
MPPAKPVIFLTILIFIGLSLVYTLRLDRPEVLVWDEQYHVAAAQSYRTGYKPAYLNRRNPPLGKELIALSARLFGKNYFAYRLPSALSAAALGALLFWTAAWLTRRWEGGLLALLFWLSSTLAFLHARLAMLDMAATLFFFAGLAAFLPVLKDPGGRHPARWIHLACLSAALGGAVKPIGYLLLPLFFLGLVAVRDAYPLRRSLPQLLAAALWTIVVTLVACYGVLGFAPAEIVTEIRRIFALQGFLHKDHPGLSSWHEWFLGRGELWYLSQPGPEGRRFAALCVQNPVLFGLGAFSGLGLAIRAALRKDPVDVFLAAAVPAQLLFWAIFKEQTILSYALPMVPVFCLNIAYALSLAVRPTAYYRVWALCLGTASGIFFYKAFPEVWGTFLP